MSKRLRNFVLVSLVSLCMWAVIISGSISAYNALPALLAPRALALTAQSSLGEFASRIGIRKTRRASVD